MPKEPRLRVRRVVKADAPLFGRYAPISAAEAVPGNNAAERISFHAEVNANYVKTAGQLGSRNTYHPCLWLIWTGDDFDWVIMNVAVAVDYSARKPGEPRASDTGVHHLSV